MTAQSTKNMTIAIANGNFVDGKHCLFMKRDKQKFQ